MCALEREIFVLDGGFATQLCTHVSAPIDGTPLWSASFLYTNPNAVIKTHLDFLRGRHILYIYIYIYIVLNYVNNRITLHTHMV
jgi:S-methylmethionine-dependent homocysteine/selenocysteine methylase